jgi:hypothetical protein
MEMHWFQRVFLDEGPDQDASMDVPAEVSRDEVVAAYRAACAHSDRIVFACPELSTLAKGSYPGEDRRASLRRIVLHMIEETARHAGHADIVIVVTTDRTLRPRRGGRRKQQQPRVAARSVLMVPARRPSKAER